MKLLADFYQAILDDNYKNIEYSFKHHNKLSAKQQFAIYSEGYRIRLIKAITADYPITLKLLGNEEFYRLAADYAKNTPSLNYNLDYYPLGFAEFIVNSDIDNFAKEIAMLESEIAKVFMLEDSQPLEQKKLQNISAEDFAATILKLRTASSLLEFSYPANDWFTKARAENTLPELPKKKNSWLLLVRNNNEVKRHELTHPQFTLLKNIKDGKNISDSLDMTVSSHQAEIEYITTNLQNWFTDWVASGVFLD
ncbi:MAG: DNA-binding domain-containing protein [Rickettsiales bacterium]